jgi:PhnB protein
MQVQPYLFLDGKCEDALAFYRKALNAEVTSLMRFKEAPDQSMIPPNAADKIMHASFRVGDTEMLASDGRCQGNANFQGFALTLNAKTEGEAQKLFGALADGGQVHMPLAKTFFSPSFGMVADKFGVSWMILAAPPG